MPARLDRVAVRVDDLDAAVADLGRLFGWTFTVVDVEVMGVRVALGQDGLELVQALPGRTPIWGRNWAGPLVSLALNTPQLDEARRRMAARGAELVAEIETPGGMMEYYYRQAAFHGIPLTLCEHAGDDFVGAIGADADRPFEPKVTEG